MSWQPLQAFDVELGARRTVAFRCNGCERVLLLATVLEDPRAFFAHDCAIVGFAHPAIDGLPPARIRTRAIVYGLAFSVALWLASGFALWRLL